MLLPIHALCFSLSLIAADVLSGPALKLPDIVVPIAGNLVSKISEDVPNSPMPPLTDSWNDPDTLIFVGIASYRDQRCATTLANLFTKAQYPERLRIGIVQQIHTEADAFHCLDDFCDSYPQHCKHRSTQFKLLEFTHQMARGPYYARYLQSTLIHEEDFCMSIDAHTDVIQNWDTEITKMWGSVQNEFGVLSGQPPDVSVMKLGGDRASVVPHLCQATIKKGNVVNLPPVEAHGLTAPLLSPLFSSTFSFSKCHMEKGGGANDPDLQMIWDEDDFVKFARIWTHGYDVYTPHRSIVFHDYHHSFSSLPSKVRRTDAMGRDIPTPVSPPVIDPLDWVSRGGKRQSRERYEKSQAKISELWSSHDNGRYGLGSRRSIYALSEFTGIYLSPPLKIVGDRCKELAWVPYDYRKGDQDAYGLAPERLPKGGRNIPVWGEEGESSRDLPVLPLDKYLSLSSTISPNIVETPVENAENAVNTGIEEEKPSSLQQTGGDSQTHEHFGGELWGVFQLVDTLLEDIVSSAEKRLGGEAGGVGRKALRLSLVLLPFFLLLVYLAFMAIGGGGVGAGGLSGAGWLGQGGKLWKGGLKKI
eukprot:gene26623-32172_t